MRHRTCKQETDLQDKTGNFYDETNIPCTMRQEAFYKGPGLPTRRNKKLFKTKYTYQYYEFEIIVRQNIPPNKTKRHTKTKKTELHKRDKGLVRRRKPPGKTRQIAL